MQFTTSNKNEVELAILNQIDEAIFFYPIVL